MRPITGATAVYGLLGHPVAQSPSPSLHNRWFRSFGLDAVYVPLPTPRAEGAVAGVRAMGIRGANVTIPLKEGLLGDLDGLSPAAAAARAVNTLYWEGPRLLGDNTDGAGLLAALQADGAAVDGRRVVVIGAGGAARGVVEALARRPLAQLVVANRHVARAAALAADLAPTAPRTPPLPQEIHEDLLDGADLVIVAVPPEASDHLRLPLERLGAEATWCDIAYRKPEPTSSARARAAGLRVLDGWGMLCWQAALAFQRWTGLSPDAEAARLDRP